MATGTNGNDALYADRPSTNPWLPGKYDRYLSGLAGNDSLYGARLDDILLGGDGEDLLFGEGGNDTYWVEDRGDRVVEDIVNGVTILFPVATAMMFCSAQPRCPNSYRGTMPIP